MIKNFFIVVLCIEFAVCPLSFSQPTVEGGDLQETAAVPSVPETMNGIQTDSELLPGYVTVNFKGADIRAVLNYLSDVGSVDIVPAPDVSGPVTLKLSNKPWQTALDIIVRNYGFAYEKDGGIIRVVTVDSLRMEELSTEVLDLNYANAEEITPAISDMLTERGKISTDARTNVLVITDVPANIYKIKRILTKLDRKTPQIMIEAKIIETELTDQENMGIDWSLRVAISGARRPTTIPFHSFLPDAGLKSKVAPQYFPVGTTGGQTTTIGTGGATATTTPADFPVGDNVLLHAASRAFPFVEADAFSFGTLDFSQFSAVLEYLKQRNNTEIISNPRITTLNGKEAKIFVGSVYNYISSIEVEAETDTVTYETEQEDIGIKLQVTPSVNADNEIVVKLKPEIKDVIGFQEITTSFSLPIFSTREAETEVMIGDGDTIFIGGLIKENTVDVVKKFPVLGDLLGDLPFIGGAVKYSSKQKSKTELVFFITVHIVKDRKAIVEGIMKGLASPSSKAFVPMGQAYIDETLAIKEQKVKASEKKGPLFDFRRAEAVKKSAAKKSEAKESKETKPWFDFRKEEE